MITGKRFLALLGGRPTNAQDFLDMSDEMYAVWTQFFDGFEDCILSGMVPTVVGPGADQISEGAMILDGEVCYFPAATGLTFPVNIKKRETNTNLKTYASAASLGTRKFIEAYVDITGAFNYTSAGGLRVQEAIAKHLAQATETQKGVAEIATQAETNAGTNDLNFITPLKLQAKQANTSVYGIIRFATLVETLTGLVSNLGVTPAGLKQVIPTTQKVVDIGDWDMNVTAGAGANIHDVPHGLGAKWKTIKSVSAIIRTDLDTTYYVLGQENFGSNNNDGGIYEINSTNIRLRITTGGNFDAVAFETPPGLNRGFVTIEYYY